MNTGTNWKKIGIIAGIVVGVLLLIYVIFSIFFMSHFFFRSTVNGVPSSGKSAAGMVSKIQDTAKDYSLEITDEDGTKTTIACHSPDYTVQSEITRHSWVGKNAEINSQ